MILLIIFLIWLSISATILYFYFKIATPEQIERDCLHTEVYHLGHYEKLEEYLANDPDIQDEVKKLKSKLKK